MRRDDQRLGDILDAVAAIEKYAAAGESAFRREELIQVWIIHHLEIIGEAASHLSSEATARAPDLPWAKVVAMRNLSTEAAA